MRNAPVMELTKTMLIMQKHPQQVARQHTCSMAAAGMPSGFGSADIPEYYDFGMRCAGYHLVHHPDDTLHFFYFQWVPSSISSPPRSLQWETGDKIKRPKLGNFVFKAKSTPPLPRVAHYSQLSLSICVFRISSVLSG